MGELRCRAVHFHRPRGIISQNRLEAKNKTFQSSEMLNNHQNQQHNSTNPSNSSNSLLTDSSTGANTSPKRSTAQQKISSPYRSEFLGKVIIVTGVTRPFGRQMALTFGREGASLTIQGPSMDRLTAVKDCLVRSGVDERRILAVSGPTLEENTAMELVERSLQRFGKIDALILSVDLISDSIEHAAVDQLFGATMRWLVYLSSLVVKPLARTDGSIVVISGNLPKTAMAAQWHTISRSALKGWVSNSAQMFGPKGIRVNGINVGSIRADFRSRQANIEEEQNFCSPASAANALRRTGTLEEIGHVALFLASAARAGFITGQIISVDGGMSGGR
uniref:SDR family oxidoreductase n=2 Tax=Globodera rostochiensis TaxID=31243 RepID=A0A914HG65_GLORO